MWTKKHMVDQIKHGQNNTQTEKIRRQKKNRQNKIHPPINTQINQLTYRQISTKRQNNTHTHTHTHRITHT